MQKDQNKLIRSLVTGGAGFIGSNLVDALIDLGHEVIVIDNESSECHDKFYWNPKAENYKYDICDYDLIAPLFKQVQYVFHLASDARIQPAILSPRKSIESNVSGTANVIELSRQNNIKRFIYSSTSSSYGTKNTIPNFEDQQPDPLTPYSSAKVFGEHLCKIYHSLYGLNTMSLRYFNVYGNRQPLKGQYAPVIGLFFKQKAEGRPLTIVGDGEQRRDFTYIDDVVNANILAAITEVDSTAFGEVYNVGNSSNHSINEIANMISTFQINIPQRIGESKETLSNTDKFRKTFGWKPTMDLPEWIRITNSINT
jgi:UDP-glucose 4-epimerase